MTKGELHRAATLVRPMRSQVLTVPKPQPGPGQIRVKLEGCGICASNLALWEGRPWFEYPREAGAPGHEGWGRVDRVGPGVHDLEEGERVAVVSGNAYAEYDVMPCASAVRLCPELDALPFPGEPLGCAMNIFERSDIRSGHSVAIVGLGFLGLLLTQLASAAGAYVTGLSRRQYSLDLASRMGARHVVRMGQGEMAQGVALDIVSGRGYDRVIEAGGVQSTLDLASALTAEYGRLVIAGYHQDGLREVNMQQWNWRALEVVNAHERAPERYVSGIERALSAVMEGRLDPFPLLTHVVSLETLDRGFELTRTRPQGFMKVLLRIEPT